MENNNISAAEKITFNEEVSKIFVIVADHVTTQKSGKPKSPKKKWYELQFSQEVCQPGWTR